jgi:hypothetical protein
MRPLQGGVAGCAPNFDGIVRFRITVEGATGMVSDATIEGGDLAGTPEGECMLGQIRGATFPRFRRESLALTYPFSI